MSWGRISHPSEVLSEGDTITVKILGINRDRERISLGLKQVLPDPWEEISIKYAVGSIIEGKVMKLVSFGAFIEIEPGVEGLVHISQISEKHIPKPDDVLEVGQIVKAKILDINKEEHKISLSIKEVENNNDNKTLEDNKDIMSYQENNEDNSGITIGDMVGDIFDKSDDNNN